MSTKPMQVFFSRFAAGGPPLQSGIAALAEVADVQSHSEGSIIHRPGQPAEHVYLVHAGLVALRRRSSPHRLITIDTRRSGDVLGETCLWTSPVHEDTAVVIAPTLITALARGCFRLFLDDHPRVERELLERIIARRDAALRRVFDVLTRSVRARLAATLLEVSDHGRVVKLRQRELAALIGATRETIAKGLLQLERDGLVERNEQGLVLRNIEGLEACARQEPQPATRKPRSTRCTAGRGRR